MKKIESDYEISYLMPKTTVFGKKKWVWEKYKTYSKGAAKDFERKLKAKKITFKTKEIKY